MPHSASTKALHVPGTAPRPAPLTDPLHLASIARSHDRCQAFGGSARNLLQSALAGRKVDADELEEIRALLDQVQKRGRA